MAPATIATALLAFVAAAHAAQTVKFPKDCRRYAGHYAELLQDRAERDVLASSASVSDAASARTARELLRIEHARERAADAAVPRETAVARSCRAANRSQYECVMQAQRYEDLGSCGLDGLPVLDLAQRTAAASNGAAPPSAEDKAAATAEVAQEWLRDGTVDLEALGTGSAAQEAGAEPPAAASEGQ